MPRRAAPDETWEDGKVALQEFGGWIKNADTKATILAAAVGIVVVALLTRIERIGDAIHADSAFRCPIIFVSALLAVSLVVLGLFMFLSLRARRPKSEFSRFAWPTVAELSDSEIEISPSGVRQEAWRQARSLARIARNKYRWFNSALATFWVTLVLFGVLVALLELPRH